MASRSWNRVELIGNLTRDPELRYTPNGAAVCTFGLATNRTYVTEGEKKEEVDFHRLVSWNKLAELCNQLLKKGTKVFISGRLQTRSWQAADGQQRQTTEIVVEDMIVLSPRANDVEIATRENISPDELPVRQEAPEKPKEKPAELNIEESEATPAEESEPAETKKTPPQEDIKDDEDLPF
ncbi:single-stranded DNA-binding protein [Candidatus Daviesbacteria bacterium]|nr:single-stranded DNA-binding protein [Candidatus Daviesbacteria bacterium]